MAKNANLSQAKAAKNDEFYTQYADIQKEVNAYIEYNPDVFRGKTILLPCDDPEWSNFTKFFAQNFEFFGLKKLISTSYAIESKNYKTDWQPTLFETENPRFKADKTRVCGKIFTLDHDTNASGRIDIDDLEWDYLQGDGDFRSAEVTALRDEADIIITNPPFSLFREFLAWVLNGDAGGSTAKQSVADADTRRAIIYNGSTSKHQPKQFLIIGNQNAITYKEVFPLIAQNKMWIGATGNGSDMVFGVPEGAVVAEQDRQKAARLGYVGNYTRLGNSCWFTNIDHGRRHQPLQLMTMADNIKFSRHKEIKGIGYQHYDNYDAIEVPYTDAIPSDYEACLGVPVSFLDKHCPEQFKIIGATESEGKGFSAGLWNPESGVAQALVNGQRVYKRIFIKPIEGGGKLLTIRELRGYIIGSYNYEPEEVEVISGIMGVPISFLDKYCPEQFEIVGITKTWFGIATKIYPEQIQIDKSGQQKRVSKLNDGPAIKVNDIENYDTYYKIGEDNYIQTYARILIRRKPTPVEP